MSSSLLPPPGSEALLMGTWVPSSLLHFSLHSEQRLGRESNPCLWPESLETPPQGHPCTPGGKAAQPEKWCGSHVVQAPGGAEPGLRPRSFCLRAQHFPHQPAGSTASLLLLGQSRCSRMGSPPADMVPFPPTALPQDWVRPPDSGSSLMFWFCAFKTQGKRPPQDMWVRRASPPDWPGL